MRRKTNHTERREIKTEVCKETRRGNVRNIRSAYIRISRYKGEYRKKKIGKMLSTDYESEFSISVFQARRRQTRYRRSWPGTYSVAYRALSCRRRRRPRSSSVTIIGPARDRPPTRGVHPATVSRETPRTGGPPSLRITMITRTTSRATRTARGAEPDSTSWRVNFRENSP